MLGGKFALCLFVMIAPIVACAADHCTNPDEYTIDKRCYVTDEQKKEKPFSASVALIDKLAYDSHTFTMRYCSGTIIKRYGLTIKNTGYFVYTAKHCVSDDRQNVRNQISIETQNGQEFTAELVKVGDYIEEDSATYHGDWAIYRLLPNDVQSNSVFSISKEVGDSYTQIKGMVGKQYSDARVIGYGSLPIVSDAEIEDFRTRYLKFLEDQGIDVANADETQLNDYGVYNHFISVSKEHNKLMSKFNKVTEWHTFVNTVDKELKISYCSYSDTMGNHDNMDSCQIWQGNSGGGIFDNDGNLIGIVTRGYSMVGDAPDVYAVGGGNVDFKRFGKLKNE